MKKIFILTSIITFTLGLKAQNTSSFEWAKSVSSSLNVDVRDIAVDFQGNSYITGGFSGTASFGPTTLTSLGNQSIFIAKIDNLGNFIWAKSAGSDGGDRGNSIAIDAQGNSYITGYFRDGAIFGNTTLTSGFYVGIFITKLDNSGNFIWVKSAAGTSSLNTYANGIAIDSIGNSYIVGRSVGVSFGSSPAITGIFTAKLDASGNDFEWAKQIGENAQFIDGHDIALDSQGNPHITGRFEGTMSFGDTTLISSEIGNFIAKLDATGNYIWVRKVGDDTWSNNRRIAIAIDSQDNSHAVGRFEGSIPFGDTTLVSNGVYVNGFITKLDTSGNFIWARRMNGGSNNFVSVEAIAIDAQGNSYIAGEFSGSSLTGATGLTVYGGVDVFIAKLNTLGVFEWVKSAGSNVSDELRGIAIDAQGNSYITGVYENTATFGVFSLTSLDSEDAFIAKISEGALSSIENNEFQTVKIYPNPTNSFLFIESEIPIEKLIIRDLSGKIVYQSSNSVEEKVDVQNLNSGIYLLEIMFENIRIIKKFVKD